MRLEKVHVTAISYVCTNDNCALIRTSNLQGLLMQRMGRLATERNIYYSYRRITIVTPIISLTLYCLDYLFRRFSEHSLR